MIEQCNKRNEEEQRAEADNIPGNESSSGGREPYLQWRVKRGGRNREPYMMTRDAKRDRNQPIRFKAKEREEAREVRENTFPAGSDELIFGGTPPPTQKTQ